jgi:hypothetical protein
MAEAKKEQMDFIEEGIDKLEGFEDVNAKTMAIPFIKLAQDLTNETKKQKDVYIEGLETGMFFNAGTQEILGDNFDMIILKFERVYIEWKPDRGGFVSYHTPENAERLATNKLKFGHWKNDVGNEFNEYYTYYGLMAGREEEGLIIFSMASTNIKTAKVLNKVMTTHKMPNGKIALPYYLIWNVKTANAEKNGQDWFAPKFRFKDYINEQQYNIIIGERKALPDKRVDYALLEDRTESQYSDDDL